MCNNNNNTISLCKTSKCCYLLVVADNLMDQSNVYSIIMDNVTLGYFNTVYLLDAPVAFKSASQSTQFEAHCNRAYQCKTPLLANDNSPSGFYELNFENEIQSFLAALSNCIVCLLSQRQSNSSSCSIISLCLSFFHFPVFSLAFLICRFRLSSSIFVVIDRHVILDSARKKNLLKSVHFVS